MARFRFRAQAALDLRRRQLEAAQRDLAHAQQDRDRARARAEEAAGAVDRARHAATALAAGACSITELQWYRFWILRLDHDRRIAAAALAGRDQEVARATAVCHRAKQRCESLERLRRRGQDTHERDERAAEAKVIDELATSRFTTGRHL